MLDFGGRLWGTLVVVVVVVAPLETVFLLLSPKPFVTPLHLTPTFFFLTASHDLFLTTQTFFATTRSAKIIDPKPLPPGSNVGGSKQGCWRCVKIRLFRLCQFSYNIVTGGEGFWIIYLGAGCTEK